MGDKGQIKSSVIMDKAFHRSRYLNSKFTPEIPSLSGPKEITVK